MTQWPIQLISSIESPYQTNSILKEYSRLKTDLCLCIEIRVYMLHLIVNFTFMDFSSKCINWRCQIELFPVANTLVFSFNAVQKLDFFSPPVEGGNSKNWFWRLFLNQDRHSLYPFGVIGVFLVMQWHVDHLSNVLIIACDFLFCSLQYLQMKWPLLDIPGAAALKDSRSPTPGHLVSPPATSYSV